MTQTKRVPMPMICWADNRRMPVSIPKTITLRADDWDGLHDNISMQPIFQLDFWNNWVPMILYPDGTKQRVELICDADRARKIECGVPT